MSRSNLEFLGRLPLVEQLRDLQIRVNRLERYPAGDDLPVSVDDVVTGEAAERRGIPSLARVNAQYVHGFTAQQVATPNALLPLDPNANIDLRRAGGEIFANRVVAGYSDNTTVMDGVDTTYRFWVGASNAGSATFSVTQTGQMYATAGSIAGMDISGCQLSIPSIYYYALRIYDSDYAAKPTLLGFQVVKAVGLAIGAMNVLQTDANVPILQLQATASDLTSAVVRLKAGSSNVRELEIGSSGSIEVSLLGNLKTSNFVSFPDSTTLTLSSGCVTATTSYHTIDTQGGAAACNCNTILGASPGRILILRSVADARDVTLKDAVDNLRLNGDFTLDDSDDVIGLLGHTTFWFEMFRSSNA